MIELSVETAVCLLALAVAFAWMAYRAGAEDGEASSDAVWIATSADDSVVATHGGSFKIISAQTFWALFAQIRECELRFGGWPRGVDTRPTEEFLRRIAEGQAVGAAVEATNVEG